MIMMRELALVQISLKGGEEADRDGFPAGLGTVLIERPMLMTSLASCSMYVCVGSREDSSAAVQKYDPSSVVVFDMGDRDAVSVSRLCSHSSDGRSPESI